MTNRQIRGAGLGRTLLNVAAAALLIVGPTLNTATDDGGFGMAAAARGGGGGMRGGGGGARGGGGGARGGGGGGFSRASSVDRAPRQASASQGSIGGANRDFSASSRPAGMGGGSQARPQAQQRPQAQARPQVQDRPASRPEVKRPEGGAKVAQARPADATKRSKPQAKPQDRAELSNKMQTHQGPKAGARGETGRLAGAAGAGALAGAGAGALAGGGDRERPGAAGDRALGDRQGDRQADRGQRQEDRAGQRGDRQGERGQAQADRQADRGQRQDDRTGQRDERRQDTQQNRDERRQNVDERRKEYADNREDIRNDRQDRMNEWREDRQDFAEDWREDRQDLWEDVYDDHHYWGDWDDDWWDDDDNGWVWGLVGGVVGYAIGAAVNSPPEGYVTVPYAGTNYQYYGGAFYQPAPAGTAVATTADTSGSGGVTYVTVPAPVGAVVEAPPLDCTIVYGPDPQDPGYCYFGGAFFLYDDKTDKYVVAEPPVGTEVPYLPEGYTVEKVGDREFYKLGPTYYRHYLAGDDEVFVVAKG